MGQGGRHPKAQAHAPHPTNPRPAAPFPRLGRHNPLPLLGAAPSLPPLVLPLPPWWLPLLWCLPVSPTELPTAGLREEKKRWTALESAKGGKERVRRRGIIFFEA